MAIYWKPGNGKVDLKGDGNANRIRVQNQPNLQRLESPAIQIGHTYGWAQQANRQQ